MPNSQTGNNMSTQEIAELIENASTWKERLSHLDETEDALREAEQRLNSAEQERDTVRRQLTEITNTSQRRARGSTNAPSDNEDDAPAAKRAQKGPAGDDNAPRSSFNEDAVQAGRKYAMNGMPWLLVLPPVDFFKTPRVPDFDMGKRHDSDANKVQGQLLEIYSMLPEHLKTHFQATWFAKAFHHGMRSQISNTAHRLRADGGEILFPGEADHLLSSDDRLAHFKDKLGYKPPANGRPEQYPPLDCPLFYEGEPVDGEYDPAERFKPYMFKLIHVLFLRGKTSANVAKKHIGRIHKPQGVYMQEKHRIRFLTPGAAALCFILGRWLVSADVRLEPTGAETSIDYKADFNNYLRILQHGLARRTTSTRALFRDWDRLVFGLEPSRYGGTGALPQAAQDAEIEAAIEALDAEEQEPPSDEDDDGNTGNGGGEGSGSGDDGDN